MEILLGIIVGALVFVIGAYVLRDTPVRRVRLRGDSARQLAAGDPSVCRAFEVLSGAALQTGNRIELLANGDELFPRLIADLREARELITWQVFWFRPGHLADEIGRVLAERARAGTEVLMLFDYFGAGGLDETYIAGLREAGVKPELYRPLRWKSLYKFPHRSHVRSVVIDGRVGYTGGFGIDDRWRGDGRAPGSWRDTHVRVEGPAVDQLQAPFIANWAECTGELLFGRAVLQAAETAPGADSQRATIMYCSPSLGSTGAERFLALTISAARRTLYITSAYFVPSGGLRDLLCRAAQRGVDVRILNPGSNTDHIATWYAGRAHYEELLRSGVRIYEYAPTMVHAKTIVADGVWLSVGSINFDNRSMKLNDEVALVAQDEALGRKLQEMFLADLEYAREVSLDDFCGRPGHERAKERASLLVAPLL